jgi:lysophospholipid acyltransferase (LPLAT)-like uncharacterized protein
MIKALSRFALKYGMIPVAHGILRLYFSTIRVQAFGEETIRAHLDGGGKAIAAIWHQRILVVLSYAVSFGAFSPPVMISQSRDGDLAAEIYRRLKFRPVRGSSSRGGRQALAAMVDDLALHPFAVHVVDGPQGPRGVIKPGLISMAQLSGVPIMPFAISVTRAWTLNSWDRFLIPKPFSRVLVRWGTLIPVPAEMDSAAFETIRQEVETRMKALQDGADRQCGWPESLL